MEPQNEPIELDDEEAKTTLDRFLEDDGGKVLSVMMEMSTEYNEQMVEARREEQFQAMWTELSLEKSEVLETVEQRENDFINNIEDDDSLPNNLPDWLLRMEAQDLVAKHVTEEMNKEINNADV